jgi:hypothetical protein
MAIPFRYEQGMELLVTEGFPPDFFDGLSQPPLVIRPGDSVVVSPEKGSGTWPEYVLVSNERGETGWVPSRALSRADGRAVVVRPFDTVTLNPARGETLWVLDPTPEGGWIWCRDARGHDGWFPTRCLVPVE